MGHGCLLEAGYGNQTRLITCELERLGHEVIISAFWGLVGGPIEVECSACDRGHKQYVLPRLYDAYGADVVIPHARKVGADIIITLIDVFVLPEGIGRQGIPVYLYLPIDHEPLPEIVRQRCQQANPIVYSLFGQRTMAQAGIVAPYVPHMIDTNTFYPDKGSQAAYKRFLGVPEDCFLIGMVAANKGERKAFCENFEAIARLMDRHDDIYLYCHTLRTNDEAGRLLDMDAIALGLATPERKGRVRFPQPYHYGMGFSDKQMREIYNAMDVLLAASKGEGFGLPILEAEACGTPVVVCDFSSMPELVGAGWKAKWCQRLWTALGSAQVVPSVDSIYECLEEAYAADRAKLVEPARAKALEYSRELVADKYWKPLLEEIEKSIRIDWPKVLEGQALGNCRDGQHNWAPVGLYVEGNLCIPCRRPTCQAHLRQGAEGQAEVPTGFGLSVDGLGLDIEDDPDGGVAKIVCKETALSSLPGMSFDPGDVVIDIGAHVGVVSIYLAKRWPDLRILAFEPIPANYERLVRNIKANNISNVVAVDKAVSADGREVQLAGDPKSNSGGYSAFATDGELYSAPAMSLADIFKTFGIDRCKLLKIDCEGAEYDILGNSEELLGRIDYLQGEFHSGKAHEEAGWTPQRLLQMCRQHIPHVEVTTCPIGQTGG